MNNMFKSVGIWLVVALVLMTVFKQFSQNQQQTSKVPLDYSQFLAGGVIKGSFDG